MTGVQTCALPIYIDFKDDDFQHYTQVCEVKKDAGLTKGGESWKIDDVEIGRASCRERV